MTIIKIDIIEMRLPLRETYLLVLKTEAFFYLYTRE